MILTGRHGWRRFRIAASAAASLTLAAGAVLIVSPSASADLGDQAMAAAPDKIRPQVQEALDADGAATLWIRFTDRADLSGASQLSDWAARGEAVAGALQATADGSQGEVIEQLTEAGVDHQAFWATNAVFASDVPAELAAQIAARPEVEGLYAPVGYKLVEPAPGESQHTINAIEWGVANINADDVWNQFGVRGEGITVASIDTGTQFDHPALVGKYRGNNGDGTFDHNYNWFDAADMCANVPCDANGHGTHTMGTMVGDDGGTNQIGVAPQANWITANGCCPSDAALIASGQWMLEPTDLNGENPDASKRPHIINNSWGSTNPSTDPFMEDILIAWAASGIFGVWSNGNDGTLGCSSSGSPGSRIVNYSVGAYDINNSIANFSGRGPGQDGETKPNISAPGVNVRSSLPGDSYGAFNGTSMAAPHVVGAIALLWSAAPALVGDIDGTRALLDNTAVDTEDLQCGGTADDNNVYGEGRLDALALMEAAPIGDTGTLAGTVTDAATGNPIADATIHVTGAIDRTVTTAHDGTYAVLLTVGDYTVTASAFGYDSQTATATITTDQTTTLNFPMTKSPSVTVSGHVNDGSGHGWPLYAKVSAEGTPARTYTSPVSGTYSLELPANATYTLTAEAQYPGYETHTQTLEVTNEDVVLNLQLVIDEFNCTETPGYEFQADIAMITTDPGDQFEDYFAELGADVDFFTVSQLSQVTGYDTVLWGYNPSSVTQATFQAFLDSTDASGTGVVFLDHAFTTWNGLKTLSRLTGQPASVSTATGGTGQPNFYEVTQAHPILDGFSVGQQIIHEPNEAGWLAWFTGYEGEGRQIIASVGRGGSIFGSGIGVQERPNNRHALLSIHSSSATRGPAGWSADGEQIFWQALQWVSPDVVFGCVPVDGGLVVGNVRDVNTGSGVNGATVASVDGAAVSTTSFATPDDPSLDDGFYWLFSSQTGSRGFTAAAEEYVPQTGTVDVAADAANELNFSLPAGLLTVDPGSVEATVELGEVATRTFTITNEGSAPAQVQLIESGGSFQILGGTGSSGSGALRQTGGPATAVQSRSGSAMGGSGGAGLASNPTAKAGVTATPVAPQAAGPNAVTITHSASQDIIASNSVACSPDGGFTTTENGFLRTFTLPDFGINGDFNVTNVSFGIENLSIAQTLTVNLYTLDGEFIYDNMTPIGTADASLPAQELTIVDVPVTGIAPAGSTLVVEIDAPDMSGSGAFFIGSNNAGQTAPSYLRSASCGITEPTDTADLGFPGMHIVINVTGDVGGDLPWLAADPATATLQPGETTQVTVTLDGNVDQPGTYAAQLAITEDTPYQVDPVDVTMTVTPPNTWGKITGTVTSIDCQGGQTPLDGAIVSIDGKAQDVTLITGPDGTYAYWMPAKNSPLTLIASANNHDPQTRKARLTPGKTVIENFTLDQLC